MKKLLIVITILVNAMNYSFAQVDSLDRKNLYIRAICAMIDSTSDKKLSTLIIRKNNEILENLPSQINGTKISYLSVDELKELAKKSENKIPVLVIRPIVNEQNLIKVSFSDYWVDYGRFRKKKGDKTLNFALDGGRIVYFRFDCSMNDWIIDRIKYWGI